MRCLRILLSATVACWVMGVSHFALAQDANASPFSITLEPVQYANVKGNVGKFEALNWMPSGAVEGVSDLTFVKDINKDISLSIEGSEFTNDNGTGHLTLKDGDSAFLQIDYNAFRKYFDNTAPVFPGVPSISGAKANSPDLQLDISFFKLEAGIGPITDPFVDIVYEHDSKNGYKSLEQWGNAYIGGIHKQFGPSWEALNDTVDSLTLNEKKDIAGVTIKADQKMEVDYNNNINYWQYLNGTVAATPVNTQVDSANNYFDAKLFGSSVRVEKWMLNDNTYAALGYHYNHIHDTDLMQTVTQENETVSGIVSLVPVSESGWNLSRADQDDHVWVGNLNTNLTHDLTFVADARYEHMGAEGSSNYYSTNTSLTDDISAMQNHEDQEGEHVGLQYSGISHTTLYAESAFDQERNWDDQTYSVSNSPGSAYFLSRIARTQDESWTVGGRIVPNRFFIFSTQVKQHANYNKYDTVSFTGPGAATGNNAILLDALNEKGVDETSTLTWKPYHWLQNSLKYQFSDTVYNPQEATASFSASSSSPIPAGGQYQISENHMLTSQFTYDISVQPIDPLLLMFDYSHVENYVRTLQASQSGSSYIPTFNSGDNSWLFSSSYSPTEYLTWTNSVCYTLSNNYVNFTSGIPLGSSFKELNFTTGFDWMYHKWFKIGPSYEYASYRDNPLVGAGTYSANIFKLNVKFAW